MSLCTTITFHRITLCVLLHLSCWSVAAQWRFGGRFIAVSTAAGWNTKCTISQSSPWPGWDEKMWWELIFHPNNFLGDYFRCQEEFNFFGNVLFVITVSWWNVININRWISCGIRRYCMNGTNFNAVVFENCVKIKLPGTYIVKLYVWWNRGQCNSNRH